ncbi:hypothetical protein HCN44_001171 [Aphidius gifuensis]|uniref:Major facilitator superfamily (MFS) profile domain-containing protein n=1 Tax=Aphidius gifuensis TaxID=684658 RepID=A0A834XLQ4_APHGI|nr:hypothetical protein HCN44_001171 [Aphidius gifuensis]
MTTKLMLYAALSGNLGILACGLFLGWTSPAFSLYEKDNIIKLSGNEKSMITSLYLGEISPPNIRGIVLTCIQIAEKTGILIEYSYGPFLSIKYGALISLLFPILFFLSFMWLPDSPYYLIRWNLHKDAKKSLIKLRGNRKNINDEMESIEKSINIADTSDGSFKDILLVSNNRRALVISITLVVIQQLTGTQVITSYAEIIFDQASVDIEGKYLTIILGILTIICTIICALFVDKKGRRPLLIISSIGCCLSMTLLGIYFNTKLFITIHYYFNWLPAIGIMLFSIFYAIGLASLPFTMMGELFANNIKAIGCSIVIIIASFSFAFVTFTFPMILDQFGLHVAFYIYAVSSGFGTFYIYFYVPETKAKSLQQIQDELHSIKY